MPGAVVSVTNDEEVTIWIVEHRAKRTFHIVKANAEKRIDGINDWNARMAKGGWPPLDHQIPRMFEITGILKEV